MARYDLYSAEIGYLLDVQSDTLSELNTRVLVPVRLPTDAPKPGRRLNPVFEISGRGHLMVTQFISAMSQNELGEPVDNLARHHDDIAAALDMLFQGF